MIACATSRSVRSVARAFASPMSSSRSPNSSSSSSSLGLEADLWIGFRRGREEKGEDEEFRFRFGGFVDFLMRLECAAENLKLIAGRE